MSDKEKLVGICHKVYSNGFVSAYDGNISLKIEEDKYLITRSGFCKGEAEEKDILAVNSEGNILSGSGKVSAESKLHFYIYKKRSEIRSVVHCHPVFSSAFAITGNGLSKNIFPEVILTLGKVPLCKYGTPSTEELPLSLEPFIEYSWAFLLENHGAVTIGTTLDDAYFKMEKLEHVSKILFAARSLGNVSELSDEDVHKLLKISKDTYGILQDERNVF